MPRGGCTMQADRIVASARCTRAIINNFVNNDDRANREAISAYRIAYIKYIYTSKETKIMAR